MRGQRKAALLAPSGILTKREKLWNAMRGLGTFTVVELARASGIDRHKYAFGDYLGGLVKASILAIEKPKAKGQLATYTLLKDLGVDAPRVRRDGSPVDEPAQEVMWRGMKVLREFSVRDLVAHAHMASVNIRLNTAISYCRWLVRGGYLKASGERFRMICDTGPKAPKILRIKQLFDVNMGTVMAGQSLEEAFDETESEA